MADYKHLKNVACEAIERSTGEFHELSKAIWSHPELCFEEKFAHDTLTDFLDKHGFKVDRNYLGIDTAFRATFGEGKPHVAVICEYDALPGIGHACGHNLVAEVGIASGLGIKAALEASDRSIGKLTVLGTPAEEGGGGKIDLIRNGAFEDFDVCGMCHPTPTTVADSSPYFLATKQVTVTYKGKPSHAAAYPWAGVNALDAAALAIMNISCMRQQMKPTWRVHGIITNGGVSSNIIPELTTLNYVLRAPTTGELETLTEKVMACFKGAAVATGCKVNMKFNEKQYLSVLRAPKLAEIFEKNGESIGVKFDKITSCDSAASSDMGNVSHQVPSIHPVYYIGDTAVNHTREFSAAAGAVTAQKYTLDQAKTLAMTAIDVLTQLDLLPVIKKEFQDAKRADAEA